MWKILLTVLWLPCIYAEEVPSRLVNTAQGPIRGYKEPNYDIYAFYGIPYATAPTGVNKFKPPLPPPKWTEPFDATSKEIICPQSDYIGLIPKTKQIKEDCLIANIYVPNTDDDMLPVAVYVHGGAYSVGFGEMVDPKPLVHNQKLIIITFNYRLSGQGFLCLGTEDIPGNAGMKDQVALLRWVQNNIAKFGGNPKDVTIAGGSAGSSSVDLLMLSKATKGLFGKVIPESGANTATFSVQQDPIKAAQEYARLLNNDVDINNVYALEELFKTVSVEELNLAVSLDRTDASLLMSPCVERDIGQEIFLDDAPVNILKSGNYPKLPMLYGFSNMEGLMRILFMNDTISDLKNMNDNFSNYLPADLQFETTAERNQVANKIRTHFFGNRVDENDILDYVDYFSDVYFAYSTLRSIKFHLEAGNDQIYLYEYSFTDENTPFVPFTKVRGATHCAQSMAIWGVEFMSVDETKLTENFKNIRDASRELWTNFITTGKPVPEGSELPEWPPVGKKWSPHMSIGKVLELRGSLLKERVNFWEEIYMKHYRSPIPPPPPPSKHSEL